MKSACAVNYSHNDDFCNIIVHRGGDYSPNSQCELCSLTKQEAWLVALWADEVFNNKTYRFLGISPWGWTIFLPEREVNERPLEKSVIERLVEAISRHSAAESDPDVIDAINAVEDALKQEATDASTTTKSLNEEKV